MDRDKIDNFPLNIIIKPFSYRCSTVIQTALSFTLCNPILFILLDYE